MKCNPWVGGSIGRRGFPMLGTGKRGLSTLIKEVFRNGEQGVFYDPFDMSTMYQDATGMIPVTGVGQPVGLVLDKSKELALGPELVTNGDFTQGTTGWSPAGGTLSIVNGKLRFTATVANEITFLRAYADPAVDAFYKLDMSFTKTTASNINVYLRGGGPHLIRDKQVIAKGVLGSPESVAIWFVPNAIGEYVEFDFISVKELAGNHAYQTNSASRPILRQNATTGAHYLEFDGSDDFLVTNNIDFTSTDEVSVFAGVRKLDDVSRGTVIELSENVGLNNGTFNLFAPAINGSSDYSFTSKGTVSRSATRVGFAAPNSSVLRGVADITNKTVNLFANQNIAASSLLDQGSGNYGNYPLYIGRRGGASLPFNGHLYSLIGIGKLTSDGETAAIEKELAKRTGVTLSV